MPEVDGILAEAQETWTEMRGLRAEGGERGQEVSFTLLDLTAGHRLGRPFPSGSRGLSFERSSLIDLSPVVSNHPQTCPFAGMVTIRTAARGLHSAC